MMKQNRNTSCPSNLLFFDTETRPKGKAVKDDAERHYLWFGFAYACRYENGKETRSKWNRFTSVSSFWKFVRSRCDNSRPLYCFAHNLGFDLTIVDFWRYSEGNAFKLDFAVLDDPPNIICVCVDDCRIYFIDTLNYWRVSLAMLGDSVGVKKVSMPEKKASKSKWDDYCKTDVNILRKSVTRLFDFIVDNDLGNFGLSAPSIAMNAFKHKFLKPNQVFIHDNTKVLELERECYYGGLVHNYYIGKVKNKVYCYDINSLYPSVMLEKMPTKYLGTITNPSIKEVKRYLGKYGVAAYVEIDNDKEPYPLRHEGKLIEATGNYHTALCGPELKRAIDTNSVKEIHYAAYYALDYLFVDYVKYFWNLRKIAKSKNDYVGDTFAKLLLNSLYGKFGQKGFEWKECTTNTLRLYYDTMGVPFPKEYETEDIRPVINWKQQKWFAIGMKEPITVRYVTGKLQIKFPMGEHYESAPIISAYITATGRERLRMLARKAGKRNCYYVDTDSLYVNLQGRTNLIRSRSVCNKTLGKLKFEGSERNVIFYAPKDYIFGDKRRLKGIRQNAEQLSENTFRQLKFEGIRSILKREPLPYILIEKIIKKNNRVYNKGVVNADGWTSYLKLPLNQVELDY